MGVAARELSMSAEALVEEAGLVLGTLAVGDFFGDMPWLGTGPARRVPLPSHPRPY
jgi:hypothetical protein